uniref:Smc-like protein Sph2 n=1 Tax=Anthurium amnicola TaxID=1678845 RepID=A0A1D1ZBW8_9ARAE
MGKGSRTACRSASHQQFKDKAKNRVDDLQGMFNDLQFARKENRAGDVVILEEQVNQMLREWKAELNEASPASSLIGGSHVSSDLSSDIRRLLQLCEEDDDATSKLSELPHINPKSEPDVQENSIQNLQGGKAAAAYQEDLSEHRFQEVDGYKANVSIESQHANVNYLEATNQLDFQLFNTHQELPHNIFLRFESGGQREEDVAHHISNLLPTICPPAAAFLRPKCALWDCPRPAKGSEWFLDYCSSVHALLALNEGPPGMIPVLRPGGIDLKDGPLFAALIAKTQGKNVGIPECEGAATTKSPWNAPELFDLNVLEGESIREWLFFDKPRRAFESGNRKQRSLPDYNGRGWHESRKQVMKEFGGLKRSYYMDPQPLANFEWHLYEYEVNNCDACALYRLELKFVDSKKSSKGKISCDSLIDLQQQMGRLNAENTLDNKRPSKGRSTKGNQKDTTGNISFALASVNQDSNGGNTYSATEQIGPAAENYGYDPNISYGYSMENLSAIMERDIT